MKKNRKCEKFRYIKVNKYFVQYLITLIGLAGDYCTEWFTDAMFEDIGLCWTMFWLAFTDVIIGTS